MDWHQLFKGGALLSLSPSKHLVAKLFKGNSFEECYRKARKWSIMKGLSSNNKALYTSNLLFYQGRELGYGGDEHILVTLLGDKK